MAEANVAIESGVKSTARKSTSKSSQSTGEFLLTVGTSIVHVTLLGYTIYLIYLCTVQPFVFFTWHPLLFSIGWLLLMSEGVMLVSRDNVLTRKLSSLMRVRLHWIVEVIAVVLSAAAFIIVFISKENNNRKHFTSWHGLLGVLSTAFCIPTVLIGTSALFSVKFKNYVQPGAHKLMHACLGIVTISLGTATMVTSVYTNWFKHRSNSDAAATIGFIIFVLALLISLLRPLNTNFNRYQRL